MKSWTAAVELTCWRTSQTLSALYVWVVRTNLSANVITPFLNIYYIKFTYISGQVVYGTYRYIAIENNKSSRKCQNMRGNRCTPPKRDMISPALQKGQGSI